MTFMKRIAAPLFLSLTLFATVGPLGGCSSRRLIANTPEIDAAGARVMVDGASGDIIKLIVANESDAPMRIYRDRVTLTTASGEVDRTPGGVGNIYTVEPGKSHKLNVRFDLSGVRVNEVVEVNMNDAIRIGDQTIRLAPISFTVLK
jgi:hypothetical protein